MKNTTALALQRSLISVCFAVLLCGPWVRAGKEPHGGGSRTAPLHRIPLADEAGEKIVPETSHAMPMSTRQTCGVCHDYANISRGWHFNSAGKGRSGQPWVVVDMASGTQLPVSDRGWEGTWTLAEVGLSSWDFVTRFGSHSPGGVGAEDASFETRWGVSGELEINCFACHNASPLQDMSEYAKQIGRENFRWATTAAAGLGEVGGMAARLNETWNVHDGMDPDDKDYAVPPSVRYDTSHFDCKGRAVLQIARGPGDDRCLQCHTVARVGQDRKHVPGDIHTTAGMACVSCHRNGEGHNIARNYEGALGEKDNKASVDLSCRSCHLGDEKASGAAKLGGWHGAPRPAHKGLPVVHLEKMSCTSCHAGVFPEVQPVQVRTSRANRLGIFGRAQWHTEAPYIAEPVFVRGTDGKIAPHRMIWPAFWAKMEGEKATPLTLEQVADAAEGILDIDRRIAAMLGVLAKNPDIGVPVFISEGKAYTANIDGGLRAVVHTGSMPQGPWAQMIPQAITPWLAGSQLTREQEKELAVGIMNALAWEADAKFVRVLVLGDKMYRPDTTGKLEVVTKPGPVVETLQWGWAKKNGDSVLAPELVSRSAMETLGQPGAITPERVVKVLGNLNVLRKGEGTAVFISDGAVYRAEGGALKQVEVTASVPEGKMPWAWMTEQKIIEFLPAFDADAESRNYATEDEGTAAKNLAADGKKVIETMLKVLNADAKDGREAVLVRNDHVYRLTSENFEQVSPEEAVQAKQEAAEAVKAVEAAKKANNLLSDTNATFVDAKTLDSVSRTQESVKQVLALVSVMKEKAEKAEAIMSFGKHHWRRTQSVGMTGMKVADVGFDLTALGNDTIAWGYAKEGKVMPLIDDFTRRTGAATVGIDQTVTDEQVGRVLAKLNGTNGGQHAYIAVGKLYTVDGSGKLAARVHEAAEPYSWPVGHDVRPASQSLGVNGCGDCHSLNSAFFFSEVTAMGPIKVTATDASLQASTTPMSEYMNLDAGFHKTFALSFGGRPLTKVVLWVASGILATVLFLVLMLVLGRLIGLVK